MRYRAIRRVRVQFSQQMSHHAITKKSIHYIAPKSEPTSNKVTIQKLRKCTLRERHRRAKSIFDVIAAKLSLGNQTYFSLSLFHHARISIYASLEMRINIMSMRPFLISSRPIDVRRASFRTRPLHQRAPAPRYLRSSLSLSRVCELRAFRFCVGVNQGKSTRTYVLVVNIVSI